MNRTSIALSALALAATLAACGDSDSGTLTISATAASPGAASAGAASRLTAADGRVEIQRVRMIIRDIKLEREGLAEEVTASNGPFLIDLAGSALAGGITQVFTVEFPEGTYDDLRFVVHPLEDGQRIGHPDLDGSRDSVAIDVSVVGGSTCQFRSDLNEQQRLAGIFRIGGDGSSDNVTIRIDPSGWFGSGASFLDPCNAGNRQAIENNIQGSIDAFEDDNRDGRNDDGPNHT